MGVIEERARVAVNAIIKGDNANLVQFLEWVVLF